MPIKMNPNLPSLQDGRHLNRSAKAVSKAFERLSSGLRINQAADDAAGLAIADRLSAQVRSLGSAIRNANDGYSMAQVADAGLAETGGMLSRMRELTIQAGNGTLTASDRNAIQGEIDQIKDELNRIGGQTEFNTNKLLDGTLTADIHIGAGANETVTLAVGDARATALGAQAQVEGTAVDANALAAGELTIDGVAIRATTAADDTTSTAGQAASAIAKAAAINEVAGETGVTATVGEAVATGGAAVGAGDLAAGDLVINDVDIGAVTGVTADDGGGNLVAAINAHSAETGVTADVADTGELVLTAEDGRNIDVQVGGGAAVHGFAADTLATGTVTLTSDEAFTVGGGAGAGRIGVAAGDYAVDRTSTIDSVSVGTPAQGGDALSVIDAAISQVSSQRSGLGSLQNRLGSTINTLQATSQNLMAAQSRVRDADFAAQTAEMTRAQIMQQSGIAIRAQANASPAVILNLLS